jgi:uroporphyrinogen-III synthase
VSDLPLAGRTILVTRARRQAGQLSEELRARGANVLEIPAIAIVPPESYAALDAALRNLSQYQWLIVTSTNGAQALGERIAAHAIDAAKEIHWQVAAVGASTAQAMREIGLTVSITPREYVAESLVDALGEQIRGKRVLLVRAAVARDLIPHALRQRGAKVDVADAYRTIIPPGSVTAIRTIFGPGGSVPDAATFTSSSTVTNFLALLREAGVAPPATMKAVSIGPITSATLREHSWEPAAEADPHDLAGLVAAVDRILTTDS